MPPSPQQASGLFAFSCRQQNVPQQPFLWYVDRTADASQLRSLNSKVSEFNLLHGKFHSWAACYTQRYIF